jgi:hypothetical protein
MENDENNRAREPGTDRTWNAGISGWNGGAVAVDSALAAQKP